MKNLLIIGASVLQLPDIMKAKDVDGLSLVILKMLYNPNK